MAQNYNRIPEVLARLQPAVDAAVLAACQSVVDDAKARVPYDPDTSEHLRDAIHTQVEPEGVYVIAGDSKVFWGHLVEHGGAVNRPPHPFLVPALEDNREAIVRAAEEAVKRAVG